MENNGDKQPITTSLVERLAELSRISIEGDAGRFVNDLKEIVAYVDELSAVDTDGVSPMDGGTTLTNVFRDDIESEETRTPPDGARSMFPETDGKGYVTVPPVFE